MMSFLKQWIISICTIIIFITAVELVLPNNSMKKYSKFVLGLILIITLIKPMIQIFDKSMNMENVIQSEIQTFNSNKTISNYDKYKNENMEATKSTFKLNIETECKKSLKDKFPNDNYNVKAKIKYDENSEIFVIKEIEVNLKDTDIKKIKKIDINTVSTSTDEKNQLNDEKGESIKSFLSSELSISKNCIHVYKGDF